MNVGALLAVIAFGGVVLAIFGVIYVGASRSCKRGELDAGVLTVLRWALLGHLTIYVLLGITTLFA